MVDNKTFYQEFEVFSKRTPSSALPTSIQLACTK